MNRVILSLFCAIIIFTTQAQKALPVQDAPFFIREFVESLEPAKRPSVDGTELYSSVVIVRFYADRKFNPTWLEEGHLTELAYEMRYEIRQAQFDGLNPKDYHLDLIDQYFRRFEEAKKSNQIPEPRLQASIDIILTDAFLILASHLRMGKVDPEKLQSIWNIQRKSPELAFDERLNEAIENKNIRNSLEGFYPNFRVYRSMRHGMREMLEMEDKFKQNPIANWKPLKNDKSIKPGEIHSLIPEIRNRLLFWGYIENYQPENDRYFDSTLLNGMKILQVRHGLEPDGIIGQGTLHALNQSPSNLIATASINLERMRWLPDDIKDLELILVNTANYQLDFLQNRDTVLTSRVIVGKSYHSTPQFSSEMSYLVFSPTWTVPTSITRNEIIPAAKKDPDYFAKKNMKILDGSGRAIDPKSIDWSKVNPRNFPYTVRQEPGEQNSLGLVKFMFPNKYSVYIHDTPSRSLFAREDRALSHGCIRIQKPFELAKKLLEFDPNWTDERIRSAMRQSSERVVNLDRKIPVVILYLTYWTDTNGNTFFRRDIYNRDAEIWTALRKGR